MTTTTTHRDVERPLERLTASDVMTRDVATVGGGATVGEAMTMMRTLGVRHLPVIADGRFAGMVDDRLVAFVLLTGSGFGAAIEQPVTTAMTHYVPQVGPTADVQRVANLLRTSGCHAIVVIDAHEHLLGIITMVDVVTAVALGIDVQPTVAADGAAPGAPRPA